MRCQGLALVPTYKGDAWWLFSSSTVGPSVSAQVLSGCRVRCQDKEQDWKEEEEGKKFLREHSGQSKIKCWNEIWSRDCVEIKANITLPSVKSWKELSGWGRGERGGKNKFSSTAENWDPSLASPFFPLGWKSANYVGITNTLDFWERRETVNMSPPVVKPSRICQSFIVGDTIIVI